MRSDRRPHQPYDNKPRAVAPKRKRRPLPAVAITIRVIAVIAVILVLLEVI